MARIAGVDLPNKHVEIALTYIFGLGRTSAKKICEATGIDPAKKINDLSNEEINELRKVIENDYKVEGRLRTEVALNIKRLMDIVVHPKPWRALSLFADLIQQLLINFQHTLHLIVCISYILLSAAYLPRYILS